MVLRDVIEPMQEGELIPFIVWELREFIEANGVTVLPAAGDIQGPEGPVPPEFGIPDIWVAVGAVTPEPIGIDEDDIMFEPKDWDGCE